MKTSKLFEAKCPECGDPITSAKSQVQLNRNIGLHKWKKHNINSPKHAEHRAYREKIAKRKLVASNGHANGQTSNELEEMLTAPKIKRSYRRRQVVPSVSAPASPLPPTPEPQMHTEVVPARLSECPCCGTRFYMAKGPQ